MYCLVYRQACYLALNLTRQRVQQTPFLDCEAQAACMRVLTLCSDYPVVGETLDGQQLKSVWLQGTQPCAQSSNACLLRASSQKCYLNMRPVFFLAILHQAEDALQQVVWQRAPLRGQVQPLQRLHQSCLLADD